MAIETVHTRSEVVNPTTKLGDLHLDMLTSLTRVRADHLCTHPAASHYQAIVDQRCQRALDRHVRNIKTLGERLDGGQLGTHGIPAAGDFGMNSRGHTRVSRYGCLRRIFHTSTLPK